MNGWMILEWAAWGGAGAMILWMLVDAVKVSRQYDEDVLLSSQEGTDELAEQFNVHGVR